MNTTDIQRYPDNYEVLSTDAALRAETIACRLRHLIYASTSVKKPEYLASAAAMQGIDIQQRGGIFEITLPCLIPKRRQARSTEFLTDPLTAALEQYVRTHAVKRFQYCVICVSHVYCRCLPERRIRDYDNLELKQFLDAVGAWLLTDDGGLLCDAYQTTELGEADCTRMFIMECMNLGIAYGQTPILDLAAGVREHLAAKGYKERDLIRFQKIWNHFARYADNCHFTVKTSG